MKLIRVAAADLNQTPLAWEHNERNIIAAIEEARAQGVTLLCLPELCISGYCCEDAFYSKHTIERCWASLDRLLRHTEGMIVSFGLPTLYKNALFNTAALVVDGELVGLAAKKHLAGDGIYYEPRWFRAWPEDVQSFVEHGGKKIPIGDVVFDVGGVKIGFEICEDAWVAKRPGSEMSVQGIDVILNPSGSHFAFGKFEVRKRFVLEGSRAFGVTYVYSNMLGNEAGRMIFDGGAIIASAGRIEALGSRFGFEDFNVTSAVVDVDAARQARQRTGSFAPDFRDEPDSELRADFHYPELTPEFHTPAFDDWETSEHIKEEEFTRAVTLALFDYLRKSYSQGFVVSLSGGADSAAVATLSALIVRRGVESIGLDAFKEKLGHIKGIQGLTDEREIVGRLLTCAYQATRNSGEVTSTAARELAGALGAAYHVIDVDALVQGYIGLTEGALGRELTWETDDITLQNIQARVRSPSIWMFANIKRALLLSTSNRSEAAVGYATMDGDTSGGVSPIAGIDKAFLRQWLRWMESIGSPAFGTVPALSYINSQQPTAELRPQEFEQTDEGDLMPYDLLDAIERAAIRDKLAPIDAYDLMRSRFPQYGLGQLGVWVERFFTLWSRNQWKRERYAPSFHLDDENLDPKTWCRWPILSGGFREDLADLRAHVARLTA